MELVHTFTLAAPVDEAWTLLTDLERLAPCFPGASLDEQGDGWATGRVNVKIGALAIEFRGKATFVELDKAANRFAVHAEGRDISGQSSADAEVTISLAADPTAGGAGTRVEVVTKLRTVGRVAQFGHGMIEDVSGLILRKFVRALEESLESSDADAGTDRPRATPAATAAVGAASPGSTPSVLDLGGVTGRVVLDRAKVPVAAGIVGLVLGWTLRSLVGRRASHGVERRHHFVYLVRR